MRKRKLFLLVAGCLALAAFLLLRFNTRREPTYQGKTISYWLQQWSLDRASPEATKGIRAMGSNAMPFILKRLRSDTRLPPQFVSSLVSRTKLQSGQRVLDWAYGAPNLLYALQSLYLFELLDHQVATSAIPTLPRT
jgi:hypothetical protein